MTILVLVSLKASFCPSSDILETLSYIQVSVLLASAAVASNAMTKIALTLILIIMDFFWGLNRSSIQSDEFKQFFERKKILGLFDRIWLDCSAW